MKFKNPLRELGKKSLLESMKTPRVVTSQHGVVMYSFLDCPDATSRTVKQVFAPERTDQKIIEILDANPQADLTKFEAALGIKILEVQRKPDPPPTPPERKRILT